MLRFGDLIQRKSFNRPSVRLGLAFLTGAVSAFAFEPTALWPLLLIAFAFLCEFTCHSKNL